MRADRWGVKPPIKRPLVSARRTGDISISSIGLKLLVTSRVFREQRGMDQEGHEAARGKAGYFNLVFTNIFQFLLSKNTQEEKKNVSNCMRRYIYLSEFKLSHNEVTLACKEVLKI